MRFGMSLRLLGLIGVAIFAVTTATTRSGVAAETFPSHFARES
jgi:hypothetical protein